MKTLALAAAVLSLSACALPEKPTTQLVCVETRYGMEVFHSNGATVVRRLDGPAWSLGNGMVYVQPPGTICTAIHS